MLLSERTHSLGLLHSVNRFDPFGPMFREYLHSRLQDSVMESMIIDDSASHKLCARRTIPSSKHQSSTGLAERVCHLFAGAGGLLLSEYSEIAFTSSESHVIVESGEVGCEHRCGYFSAVGAMADEGVGESGCFERLHRKFNARSLAEWVESRTITIWTAPHAQVAVASSSFDQPSSVRPWRGNLTDRSSDMS